MSSFFFLAVTKGLNLSYGFPTFSMMFVAHIRSSSFLNDFMSASGTSRVDCTMEITSSRSTVLYSHCALPIPVNYPGTYQACVSVTVVLRVDPVDETKFIASLEAQDGLLLLYDKKLEQCTSLV